MFINDTTYLSDEKICSACGVFDMTIPTTEFPLARNAPFQFVCWPYELTETPVDNE